MTGRDPPIADRPPRGQRPAREHDGLHRAPPHETRERNGSGRPDGEASGSPGDRAPTPANGRREHPERKAERDSSYWLG